jgi:hypothetical protein
MNTEEILRDRLSDVVSDVVPRDGLTVADLATAARRRQRTQRSALGTLGVLVTAAIVLVVTVFTPRAHEAAEPTAATVTTSKQLLAIVRPIAVKVLAPYHLKPLTITVADYPGPTAYDPSVAISAGRLPAPGPGQVHFAAVTLSVSQHAFRTDPLSSVLVGTAFGTRPPPTRSGTLPNGLRWAATAGQGSGSLADAELPDNISINGQAAAALTFGPTGRSVFGNNPMAAHLLRIVQQIGSQLPPMTPLPLPSALVWTPGPHDAALTSLMTAAARQPDPAAKAQILYVRATVVDHQSKQNDTEELWYRRNDKPGATFGYGTWNGKPHSGFSGGQIWARGFGSAYVDWNGLSSVPTTLKGLQDIAYHGFSESRATPSTIFGDIVSFVEETPASPRLQAALAVLAGQLPGAEVTVGTRDPLGRPAIAIDLRGNVIAGRVYFSPTTGTFLAAAELNNALQVKQYRAVTQVASVPAVPLRPDGTKAHK